MQEDRWISIESSLADTRSQGIESKAAAKQAEKPGDKAAKIANKNANRLLGPIVSSGWDLFEVIYYQGYVTEGALRGAWTLVGTYILGFLGEEKFGRFGYLVVSTLGSWIGGKLGLCLMRLLMAYISCFTWVEQSNMYQMGGLNTCWIPKTIDVFKYTKYYVSKVIASAFLTFADSTKNFKIISWKPEPCYSVCRKYT
ncbi:hypothetical protein Hanom_Chr03g00210891 [Helianthus anomalus]